MPSKKDNFEINLLYGFLVICMKALLVTPSYFPIMGGSEVLTQEISVKLDEVGIHADIMTYNMTEKWKPLWKEEVVNDGRANVFKEPGFASFPRFFKLFFSSFIINVIPKPSFLKKLNQYDIIHFIGETDFSLLFFSFFIKKPKLFHCVGLFRRGGIYKYYTSHRPLIGKLFKRFFHRFADKFIVSSLEEESLLMDLGVPKSKIVILREGVKTELFQPSFNKPKENMLLFVGRIDKQKGLHTLLHALPHIGTSVELVIIGPPWNSEYTREVEKTSNAINAVGFHKVTFLGKMASKDLVAWYQKASIVVCPYEYETYSNVVREALACGTPVVSTGSHLLGKCPDGILVVDRNPKDLAIAVDNLLRNPALRLEMGKQGRAIIEQFYSWNSISKELDRLYKECTL
jgi:glycosyltransferase involved in cell wall biosynthesis